MQNSETHNQEIANYAFDTIDELLEASTYWEEPDPDYLYKVVHGVILLARTMMTPIHAYTRLNMVDYIKAHPEECVPYIKAHSEEFSKYRPEEQENEA